MKSTFLFINPAILIFFFLLCNFLARAVGPVEPVLKSDPLESSMDLLFSKDADFEKRLNWREKIALKILKKKLTKRLEKNHRNEDTLTIKEEKIVEAFGVLAGLASVTGLVFFLIAMNWGAVAFLMMGLVLGIISIVRYLLNPNEFNPVGLVMAGLALIIVFLIFSSI